MSYFFKAVCELSELFKDKKLTTIEGVMVVDYHFVNNLLSEIDKSEIDKTLNELIQFSLDISYIVNGYLNLEEYDKKYCNCFNPKVLSKLNSKYFNSMLEVKKEFYNEYFSDVIKIYEELKQDG